MPTTWEGLAASALALYGLSNELIRADRVSLFKLRDFLGDKWLENASRQGHQLYWTLNHYAPWRVGWLANFVQTLNYLSKDPSLPRLLGRIKDPKEYRGAEAEVEVASRLIEAGLKVRLAPSGGDRKRTPDLSTIVNGQELLVEVTDVRPTRAYESADRTHQEIFLSIIRRQPQSGRVCFKIYRPLSRPHLREVIGTLDKAISDFATGGHSIVQVHEEGVIDFYMFKEDAIDQLPQQARSLSMEGPDLPPVQNEIWRLP